MGKNAINSTINDDNVIDQKTSRIFRKVYSRYIKRQLKYGGKIVLVVLDHELKKSQLLLETFLQCLYRLGINFSQYLYYEGKGKGNAQLSH